MAYLIEHGQSVFLSLTRAEKAGNWLLFINSTSARGCRAYRESAEGHDRRQNTVPCTLQTWMKKLEQVRLEVDALRPSVPSANQRAER